MVGNCGAREREEPVSLVGPGSQEEDSALHFHIPKVGLARSVHRDSVPAFVETPDWTQARLAVCPEASDSAFLGLSVPICKMG